MTRDEILEKARREYPVGTVIKRMKLGAGAADEEQMVSQLLVWEKNGISHDGIYWVYFNGQWADIVSKPNTMNTKFKVNETVLYKKTKHVIVSFTKNGEQCCIQGPFGQHNGQHNDYVYDEKGQTIEIIKSENHKRYFVSCNELEKTDEELDLNFCLNWCVLRTKENHKVINKWFKDNDHGSPSADVEYIFIHDRTYSTRSLKPIDKRLLSFEEFKRLAGISAEDSPNSDWAHFKTGVWYQSTKFPTHIWKHSETCSNKIRYSECIFSERYSKGDSVISNEYMIDHVIKCPQELLNKYLPAGHPDIIPTEVKPVKKIAESYIGRVIQAVEDHPWGGDVFKGDLGVIISANKANFKKHSGYRLADNWYERPESITLMPADFKIDKDFKPIIDQSDIPFSEVIVQMAKQMYPIGTKYICPLNKTEFEVRDTRDTYNIYNKANGLNDVDGGLGQGYLRYRGEWAEIVGKLTQTSESITINDISASMITDSRPKILGKEPEVEQFVTKTKALNVELKQKEQIFYF